MLLLPLLLLTACADKIQCDPVAIDLSGVLAEDLVGTWGGWGVDSPVYFVFEPEGAWRWVESPNRYAPRGLQAEGSWELDGDVLSTDQDGFISDYGVVTVETDTLYVNGDTEVNGHQRLECTGYGF